MTAADTATTPTDLEKYIYWMLEIPHTQELQSAYEKANDINPDTPDKPTHYKILEELAHCCVSRANTQYTSNWTEPMEFGWFKIARIISSRLGHWANESNNSLIDLAKKYPEADIFGPISLEESNVVLESLKDIGFSIEKDRNLWQNLTIPEQTCVVPLVTRRQIAPTPPIRFDFLAITEPKFSDSQSEAAKEYRRRELRRQVERLEAAKCRV